VTLKIDLSTAKTEVFILVPKCSNAESGENTSGGFRGGAGGAAAPWLGKWPKVGPFGPFRVSNSDVML